MADNEFEEERLRRIAENQARMKSLGVLTATKEVGKSERKAQGTSCPQARPRPKAAPTELRRSSRQEGRERVIYTESRGEFNESGEPRSRVGPKRRREPKAPGSIPVNAIMPSEEIFMQTMEIAEEGVQEVQNPVYLKSMLGSHVSGGYWLQAPAPMNRYMPKVKTEFPLEYEGTTWDVVWLPRKSGAGLSGGWRTFAIDVELKVGDVVGFEMIGQGRVQAHVFRADFTPTDAQIEAATGKAPGAASENRQGAGCSGKGAISDHEIILDDSAEKENNAPQEGGGRKRRRVKRSKSGTGLKKGSCRGGKRQAAVDESKDIDCEEMDEGENGALAENSMHELHERLSVPSEDEGEEEEFVVEHIVKKIGKGKNALYLIKWLGYGEEENTLEPASSLSQAPHMYKWL